MPPYCGAKKSKNSYTTVFVRAGIRGFTILIKSKVASTSTSRNQRRRDAGVGKFRFALVCVFCFGVVLANAATKPASAPRHTQEQTEVLFLSSADPDSPDVADLIEQAEKHILDGATAPVHFGLEYLQPSLLSSDPSRKRAAASYLFEKYRGHTFDLVVAINQDTVDLAEQMRAKLSPEAALLFFVVNPEDPSVWLKRQPGRTGVVRNVNYLPTLELALRQNPGTSHVIVVSGSSDAEKLDTKLAREQFLPYESNLEFEYLTDLQFSQLGPRLAQAPAHSVVVFLDFMMDSSGEQFIPARILPNIAKSANLPIYGTFSSVVDGGVAGGSIADLGEVGRILGEDGVRILKGEKPETIAVTTGDFQHYAVDWRQLHRWGFAESQLPAETEVRYWEYSPWETYRWKVLGLIAGLLIVLLLRNIANRKRAQEKLRQREMDLALAQRLARVGSWQWDAKTGAVTWSEELYHIIGFDPGLPIPPYEEFARFLMPESWARLTSTMEAALLGGTIPDLDLELDRGDGTRRWVTARGEAVRDAGGQLTYLRGTVQDVTERKQADQAQFRLASIVESSDDAIISKDLDGVIVTWNRGAKRIFGFTEAEAIGQHIGILVPPEFRAEEEAILRGSRVGETIEHLETVRVTKEGKQIDVSVSVSPVRDATGKITGCSTIARDITDQRQAKEELRRSEERFSKAFRQSPMALTLVNANTNRYLDVNNAFERMLGYTRADVIGKSALEIGLWLNPADSARVALKWASQGSLREAECEWRSKDGRTVIALVSIELIEINTEQCFLGVVADITDRKQTEQALAESERRFRLMANTAPVLIWTSGLDKLCNYFNQPWLDFTGRSLVEELGNGWTHGVHPDDVTAWTDTYSKAFDARQPFQMQFRLRRHDGQYRWILDVAVPRFNGDGSFAGYIGSCIDITDRRLAEEVLSTVGRKLIEAQEAERRRIARELHDDINQRMALLANGLQELGESALGRDLPQRVELRNMWQLTNEIATDIEHMSHQLHPSKLHYLGLASAVRDLCRESSRQYKIEIDCVVRDLPEDLEETTSLSLFRVIQEALRNVGKHSHAQHVKVELTFRSGLIRLRVSDDGDGFDIYDMDHAHGLGLISMRERLRSVGGEFSIWSKPAMGTQVEGRVPATSKAARGSGSPGPDPAQRLQKQPPPTVNFDSSRGQ